MTAPTRPALRWHGGKWTLAPWILEHMPPHRIYVEPFGGAASVLLRKPRAYAEVYNDLDDDVVNLFRILRGSLCDDLIFKLKMTPFSAVEFALGYEPTEDPVERARRLVVRSFMGFGSNGHYRRTGFRAVSKQTNTAPAADWAAYPDQLRAVVERLRGVVIMNRPAIEVMKAQDSADTLHYVDPPYQTDTRSDGRPDYAHEMTDAQHAELLHFLRALEGKVILSGYPSELYDTALADWHRVERKALADGAKERTEVLWMNYQLAPKRPRLL